MTTIATDGKSMAGDGLCTGNGIVHDTNTPKVRRLKDGRIVGMSGTIYDMDVFIAWLADGGELPALDDFEALVLAPDGVCRSYNAKGRSMLQPTPAITGSGGAIALGAMLAGATPERAVQIACGRDTHTGGRVTALHLGDA